LFQSLPAFLPSIDTDDYLGRPIGCLTKTMISPILGFVSDFPTIALLSTETPENCKPCFPAWVTMPMPLNSAIHRLNIRRTSKFLESLIGAIALDKKQWSFIWTIQCQCT